MPNPTVRNKATTGELVQAGDPANNAVRVNVVAGAGSGGTAATDDAAFTPGGSSYTPAGGTYRSVLDPVDDGDGGAFAMTQTRAIHASLRDSAGDSAMDDANNAVRVNIVAGAGSGGTAMTDDTAFTPAGTSITPMGAYYDDTSPDPIDEGDAGIPRMSADRILYDQTPDRTASGTLAALDATVSISMDGRRAAGFFITTANLSATVIGEISVDGGTTWLQTLIWELANQQIIPSISFTGGALTRNYEFIAPGGVSNARVRVSAYTSGTASATVRATHTTNAHYVAQSVTATGWNIAGKTGHDVGTDAFNLPVLVGGRASAAAPANVSADNDATHAWYLRNGAAAVQLTNSGTLYDARDTNNTTKTLKTEDINHAAAGDNTIIASVVSKRLKVHAVVLNAVGTVSIKWKDGAATDLTGAMDFQAREGYTVAVTPPGWVLATTAGNALVLNLSAAVGVRGWVSYWDDDAT